MNFIEKETEILNALENNNYFVFGHQQDKERLLELFGEKLLTFPEYVNVVIREQIMIPIWRFRLEAEQLKDNIQNLDTKRRRAHDYAISSVKWLNRLCKELQLEPFATIDVDDRHAVAEMVGNIVGEMYNIGIGKTFEEVTSRNQEYRLPDQKQTLLDMVEHLKAECARYTTQKEGDKMVYEHDEI